MYLIANVTDKSISISDLNITMKPKQAFDLHLMSLKIRPEDSKNLKEARKLGWVKILKKDVDQKPIVVKEEHQHKHQHIHNDGVDQNQLLEALKSLLTNELSKQKTGVQPPTPIIQPIAALAPVQAPVPIINTTQADNSEVLRAIAELNKKINNQKTPIIYQQVQTIEDKSDNIDESALDEVTRNKIHAKAMNKITEGVDVNIEMEESQVIDVALNDNISELGELGLP